MGRNWEQRERKLKRKKDRMRISGRSVFLHQFLQWKKAQEIKKNKKKKKDGG